MKTKLYRFQKVGVLGIEKADGRALLADEMGLGKTVQALWWMKRFLPHRNPNKAPTVIIAPAGMKYHWSQEAAHHVRLSSEIVAGRKPPTFLGAKHYRNRIYVINYDILGSPSPLVDSWTNFLVKINPSLLILDECHYIKSLNAQRTKAVRWLGKDVPHIIAISGTPMTNRPVELFPVINMLWPNKFPSFFSYASKHCSPRRTPWGWEFKGATRLPELHAKLKKCGMIRRLKEDVLKDLPPRTRTVQAVDIPNRKEYEQAEREFLRWLAKKSKRRALRARNAERLVQMGYLKRLAAELKLPQTIDWIKNWLEETDSKLLVFAIHKKIIRALEAAFPNISVTVDGSTPALARHKRIRAFNRKEKVRLFFGNIDAAGVGWSCKSASDVLFAELAWVPGKHVQAEDRIRGIGRGVRGQKAHSHFLVAKNTIEERLCEINQEKQAVLDQVLDGADETVRSLNILDLLEQSYRKNPRSLK